MCSSVDLLTGGTDEEELMGFFSQNNHFTENQVVFMRFHSHTTPDMLLKRSAQDENVWTDFYKITVVRNPWDLLVSGYWYMMAEMNLDLKEREYVLISGKDKLSTIKKKFKRWADTTLTFESHWPNEPPKLVTPFEWFTEKSHDFCHPAIDHYLKFESIDSEYQKLCSDLNFAWLPLPRLKTSQRKLKYHYSEYYDDELRQRVSAQFSTIIDQFDYSYNKS